MRAVLVFGGVLRFDFSKLSISELTEIPLYSNTCVMKIGLPTIADKIVELTQCTFNLNTVDKIYSTLSSKKIIYKKNVGLLIKRRGISVVAPHFRG